MWTGPVTFGCVVDAAVAVRRAGGRGLLRSLPMTRRPHVGTLGEKPLHAALKRRYAAADGRTEVPVGPYVVDVVHGGELVEIQTGGFSSMKRKLTTLLDDGYAVRVVHPIAAEKTIVKIDEASGEVLSRRRSPKRGAVVDLFAELVSFPELVAHPGLTLEVLLVREEELRRFDGTRGWRRHGWVVEERRLVEVVDRRVVDAPPALAALLPRALPASFTTADLAEAIGRPRRLAQQMSYCLRRLDLIEAVGKDGNAHVYRRADPGG